MNNPIYLLDRSGADLDDKCGMALWWNRIQDGTGIVPAEENDALETGKEIHDDLSRLAESGDCGAAADQLVDEILGQIAGPDPILSIREHAYRRAGWAVAFALYIEPRIRQEWENVAVEGELILDRTPLWVPTTPDRVLRHKVSGIYRYLEYKSSISASKNWLDSWKYAIQLHIGMKAVEEELGIKVAYSQIMALMKGDNRDGLLKHPYVWGYYNSDTGQWTHDYSRARGHAWNPRPVWEYPDGLVGWVRACGEDVALSQFPHTEPVMLNERMLDQWVTRKLARSRQVAEVAAKCVDNQEERLVYFEPRTSHCRPAFGFACPYRLACWNATVNANPLASGEYVKRVPHHQIEINLRKEMEND